MALNPIVFTEKVVRSFLRYQLTAYPFADGRLHGQMRDLLSLDRTRQSPLLKGPYISLSRPFRQGASVESLVAEGLLHPLMGQRIPVEITHLYGHQEEAIRAIRAGHTTLVSTGTGSGKTESFLYPIVSRCLELRDGEAPPGISAVLVYPMNALAEDQLWRIRSLLAGTGVPFGMYVGKTPEREAEVAGVRLPPGSSRADYEGRLAEVRREKRGETVYPAEEVCSREVMRTPGRQPRILLTNVKQLELLLTRQRDVELFRDATLDFLVFDEAHTFTGAQGAETACLIRRLRAFCGRDPRETVCVATSATIVDEENPNAARDFASRFFGVRGDSVVTVGEAYESEIWESSSRAGSEAPADPSAVLEDCVEAVEDDTGEQVRAAWRRLSGEALPQGEWSEKLFDALSAREIVVCLSDLLTHPRSLDELPGALHDRVGREVTEAEILSWLTLAAAARREGRPLLRPVVHGFVRGISGAVVSFPRPEDPPRLWLAAEDEVESRNGEGGHAHFPVTTCTTCGQHYFATFLKDFEFVERSPGGGEATRGSSYWEPLEEAQGGKRVVLIDQLAGGTDDEELDEHTRTAPLFFCRHCGAAHPANVGRCGHCAGIDVPVTLYAIRHNRDNLGHLTSCLSCGSTGRRIGTTYREPARPVRATNVADVHVLAQDMVHNSERQRLLVFCDNRQDAAFQAGWMKDHARRFRLRALMADGLAGGPVSVGDLARFIDDRLEENEALSRALVPEVWLVARREGSGGRHAQERLKFLRIQVLREVTLSARQPIGLEPWGRMRVEYNGLHSALPWIQRQAHHLGMPADDLRDGVATLLDYLRRKKILHDADREIFTKYWMDGDPEIQQGYLQSFGSPTGTKFRRQDGEKPELVTQWISDRGDTTIRQMMKKWGVEPDRVEEFAEGLFRMLVDIRLLRPVTLKGARGNPLPNLSGVYQLDADSLRLSANRGVWRCGSCRRRTTRRTPRDACPAWRCDGVLAFDPENPDNYDLQLLDQGYSMIRPEEHTAMVPHDERERLENLFKGDSEAVNCFVCTPTLELGVDIGQLDTVLMRNVPPLPANYWQRAGRAGRRHRMAVDLTYCRPVSHDRAYFADPLKLLSGRIDPPAFNLRNELMVAKHAHATIITRLHQYLRDERMSSAERELIGETLESCLPSRISSYLFEAGLIRSTPFDLGPLELLIRRHETDLTAYVERVFRQEWPDADASVVSEEALRSHVQSMVPELREVIARLEKRLRWALGQIVRLNALRERQGDLEPEDESLYRRCDTLIKRLKGTSQRSRREAEGYDDVSTFGVLAAEGFLPGYGLEIGQILGTAEIPYWRQGAMQFTLPRPPSVALREYVPGNLIYANGNRFVARRFRRDADENRHQMPVFEISPERQAVKETSDAAAVTGLGALRLRTMAVSDVDLAHISHISDEEELRFQLGVAVHGIERGEHNGGAAFDWGGQAVHHRRGVRLRLVNVGASKAIEGSGRFGYPVCTVCGQSRSPLSSEREREHFANDHLERCGREVEPIGFHADIVADVLSLPACADQTTAFSVLEAIRFAATRVLDMHSDDLQILVVGHVDRDEVDALLWDPMPGGSGLLDQILARFDEIVAIAREVVQDCPSVCEASCVDCLQTFRNGFYHKYLDRRAALRRLEEWGPGLSHSHAILAVHPQRQPDEDAQPANEAERRLRHLLLAAGFEEGVRGEQIRLDPTIGTTTPDVVYRASHHRSDEGVCIYLDGLSGHLHGNPATAARDRLIREWLENNGYDVIAIAASQLHDGAAMSRHFQRLAGFLQNTELRRHFRNSDWYEAAEREAAAESPKRGLRIVRPKNGDRYVRCVPLVTLRAAAGAFGDPQHLVDIEDAEWVAVDSGRALRPGMFVARVVGRSMEPALPDGSYCLFAAPVIGSRVGRIVLVQLRDEMDPETGERFTVKRYRSEKIDVDDGVWRHLRITLEPLNPEFEPIELVADDEDRLRVCAEFLEIVWKG